MRHWIFPALLAVLGGCTTGVTIPGDWIKRCPPPPSHSEMRTLCRHDALTYKDVVKHVDAVFLKDAFPGIDKTALDTYTFSTEPAFEKPLTYDGKECRSIFCKRHGDRLTYNCYIVVRLTGVSQDPDLADVQTALFWREDVTVPISPAE